MTNKITLASINAAVEAKYGATELEDVGVVLQNPARLHPKKREQLIDLLSNDEVDEVEEGAEKPAVSEDELIAKYIAVIKLVAATDAQATKLIEAMSPNGFVDMIVLSEVVKSYLEGQKVGEASASAA